MSRDPITENGGLNLYAYVWNKPISSYDYLGLDPGRIIIYPGNPPDGDRDRIEESFSVLVNANSGKWTGLEVSSIRDANKQLRGLSCGCIKELNILGHGGPGFQNIVSVNDSNKESGRLIARFNKTNNKWEYGGFQIFSKVKFCDDCVVYLRGCSTGSGEAGKKLLQMIANVTGCKAASWDCPTTELTPFQGLPGGKGFFGFFGGPNVIKIPDTDF